MKKLISLALCAVMMLSLCVSASAAAYSDVADDAWYASCVTDVTDRGIMNGTGNGKFTPDADLSRAMMVTVLWRITGSPAPAAPVSFDDVAPGQWYSDAIAWAQETGIVLGMGHNKFAPERHLIREEMATIFYRWAKTQNLDVSIKSTDDAAYQGASDWALEAVAWAMSHDLLTKIPVTLPLGWGWYHVVGAAAKRAEVAVFISHMYDFYQIP